MSNELARIASREIRPRFIEMALARQARDIHDEVRLAGLRVDGALALSGHIAEGLSGLYERTQRLAGDDPGLNLILAPIFATAAAQANNIQRGLYSTWRL